jgi:hypothetical protein
MAEYDEYIRKCLILLESQKARYKKASLYKGQKPQASMKQSRKELQKAFGYTVWCSLNPIFFEQRAQILIFSGFGEADVWLVFRVAQAQLFL